MFDLSGLFAAFDLQNLFAGLSPDLVFEWLDIWVNYISDSLNAIFGLLSP